MYGTCMFGMGSLRRAAPERQWICTGKVRARSKVTGRGLFLYVKYVWLGLFQQTTLPTGRDVAISEG